MRFLLVILMLLVTSSVQAVPDGDYLNTTQAGLTLKLAGDSYYLFANTAQGYQEFENGRYQEDGQSLLFYPEWSISGQNQNSSGQLADSCTIRWGQSGDFALSNCSPSDNQSGDNSNSQLVAYPSVCQSFDYAFFSVDTVCIPGLLVNESVYDVALRLSSSDEPWLFQLIALRASSSAGNVYYGQFESDNGVLTIPKINVGGTLYEVKMSLASVQPHITFALQGVEKATSPADNITNPDPDPSQNGSPVNNIILNYRVLVEYFEYLTAEQVAGIFRRLTETQILELDVFSAFGNLVHFRACQADPSLLFNGSISTNVNCTQQAAAWVETAQYTNNPTEYAYTQRDTLLNSIKCSTGEIDRQTCAVYMGGLNNYGTISNNISLSIINMSTGSCFVGEPGCVP